MKSCVVPTGNRRRSRMTPAMIVVILAFTLGVIWGSFAACRVEGAVLQEYLQGYRIAVESGSLPQSLTELLWKCFRGPLIACLLGFTAFGLVGVPAVFCCKGFLLAYGVTAFLRIDGSRGLLPAFGALGVTAMLSLPALVMIGTQSWRAAGIRLTRPAMKHKIYDRAWRVTCCICGFLVTGQLLLERYAVLPLLQWALEFG